jgi:hypothetical protein
VTQYQLTVVNNSVNFVDLCVYQSQPDLSTYDVQTLAWAVKPTNPTGTVVFTWEEDYSFVWAHNGALAAGVQFVSSQAWPADPSDPNLQQVLFTMANSAYTFEQGAAVPNPVTGSLYIGETDQIPLNQASVGIGMSGSGTHIVSAQPNQVLMLTPHPEYWITAGTFTQGTVIDVEQITNVGDLVFPPGVFALNATLNVDNTWTVTATP